MTQEFKPGARWASTVCETEVVIIRAECVLGCGGADMVPLGAERSTDAQPAEGFAGGTKLGKRHDDADSGIEVLCTKAGPAALSVNGTAIAVKESKPLPSSD